VLFDVNETLSDMSHMAGAFEHVGAPGHLSQLWFAHVLRDGFALVSVHEQQPFEAVARAALRALLSRPDVQLSLSVDSAVDSIIAAFKALPVHADVAPAMQALQTAGFKLATLTNGSRSNSEALLERAGVRAAFDAVLSVEDAETWKPGTNSYNYAVQQLKGASASEVVLVAVHPWDLHGAHKAGLRTALLDRAPSPTPYPPFFATPTYTVRDLRELAQQLQQH